MMSLSEIINKIITFEKKLFVKNKFNFNLFFQFKPLNLIKKKKKWDLINPQLYLMINL